MTLRIVGAGLGRTGTMSLKRALERLLGAPCYHMIEVFQRPEHLPVWHRAVLGEMPDWHRLFEGYAAAVDWPVSAFWREISAAFPDAIVLLSVRDPESWWRSASSTIFPSTLKAEGDWRRMIDDLFASRFTAAITDQAACIAAYEKHVAQVRATVEPGRLVEWQASEGWAPLCAALGVPIPDQPFPHENTTKDFQSRGT
jgi:sulfotransferase family protein